MPSVVREWRIRLHQPGTDVPSDDTVALVLGEDDYLTEPPSGIGSQTLRVLEGRLESQPYSLQVADPAGAVTAHLFSGGRLQIVGRWAEIETRLDGGAWTRADLRRVSRIASPDPVTWEFELTADASLLHDLLFETSTDIQLYPLGPTRAWHRHPPVGLASPFDLGDPGEVIEVDGDRLRIRLQTTVAVPREMVGVVRDQLVGLALEVDGVDYTVIGFGADADPADLDAAVGLWIGDPPRMPEGVWVEWPSHWFSAGQYVNPFRLHWPAGVPTSPMTPRLVGPVIDDSYLEVAGHGYRLDALVRDVLDGVYGGRRMPFDEAAIAGLADLGDEGHWFVARGPIPRGVFLAEYVWRPYLVAPQTNADGTLEPVPMWAGDAVSRAGLYVFDNDNVAGAVHFAAGGSEVANAWALSALHADRRLPAAAALFPRLDLTDVIRTRSVAGVTDVQEPYDLQMPAQVMRRVWSEAMPDLFASRVFALAGDGVGTYRLTAAVAEDSPAPGELVVLDMSSLQGPEAQTGSRAGNRIAIVVSRRRSYGPGSLRYEYDLWDAGWRAHSPDHADSAHADTHSDSNQGGHFDAHADEHIDIHTDSAHGDGHGDANHVDGHGDQSHSDQHADSAEHFDVHFDSGHNDAHVDVPHSDTHLDAGHGDGHTDHVYRQVEGHCDAVLAGEECAHFDTHTDTAHGDQHWDNAHTDTHGDAAHNDQHGDLAHGDSHQDGNHTDTHSDAGHVDAHDDSDHADEHADLTHADAHQDGAHTDGHADSLHTDWHDDSAHSDSHVDLGHQDVHVDSSHTDGHSDVAHVDLHDDEHGDTHLDATHIDSHGDEAGPGEHVDNIHQDVSHVDSEHADSHSDSHTDTAHSDSHGDQASQNTHTDVTGFKIDESSDCDPNLFDGIPCHVDTHGDIPIHSDSHTDVSHVDEHGDTAHSDTAHGDTAHTDDAHGDQAPHSDSHLDSGGHDDAHDDTAHDDAHSDTAHEDSHGDTGHTDTHTDSNHTDSHGDSDHSDAHRDQAHSDVHADLEN